MIKAKIHNGPIILGLDSENVKRLMDNQPIRIDLSEVGGSDNVILMYGDTTDDIKATLNQHFILPE